jgi:hypothetical protein
VADLLEGQGRQGELPGGDQDRHRALRINRRSDHRLVLLGRTAEGARAIGPAVHGLMRVATRIDLPLILMAGFMMAVRVVPLRALK